MKSVLTRLFSFLTLFLLIQAYSPAHAMHAGSKTLMDTSERLFSSATRLAQQQKSKSWLSALNPFNWGRKASSKEPSVPADAVTALRGDAGAAGAVAASAPRVETRVVATPLGIYAVPTSRPTSATTATARRTPSPRGAGEPHPIELDAIVRAHTSRVPDSVLRARMDEQLIEMRRKMTRAEESARKFRKRHNPGKK